MSGTKTKMSRRSFLKAAAIGGFAAHTGGLIAAGKIAGSSSETYTGWESNNPATNFFNRKSFEFTGPAHKPVGEVRRPSHMTDYVFGRVGMFERAYRAKPEWKLDDPVENLELPPPLVAFYKEFPERLEWDFRTFSETIPNNFKDRRKYGNYYFLLMPMKQDSQQLQAPFPDLMHHLKSQIFRQQVLAA